MVGRNGSFCSAGSANDLPQVLEVHLLGTPSHHYWHVLLAHELTNYSQIYIMPKIKPTSINESVGVVKVNPAVSALPDVKL